MGQSASRSAAEGASPDDSQQQIPPNRRSTLWRRSNVPVHIVSPDHENLWPSTVSSTTRQERRQILSNNRLSRLLQPASESTTDDRDNVAASPQPAQIGRLRRMYNSVSSSRRERGIFADENIELPVPTEDDSLQSHVPELEGTTPDQHENIVNSAAAVSEPDAEPTRPSRQPSTSRRSSLRIPSSLSDRLMTRRNARSNSSGDSGLRRGRRPASSSRPLEDNTALLSRLLSVAAAATAATLLEGHERALSEARGQTLDGDDGSFGSFLQSLESGRLATALRAGAQQDPGSGGSGHTPLNFFRMFRFGTTTTPTNTPSASQTLSTVAASPSEPTAPTFESTTTSPSAEPAPAPESRMVPIIIVGIRAVTPGAATSDDAEVPPFLDALSSLPTGPFGANARPNDTVEPITRPQTEADRPVTRRRASDSGSVERNNRSGYDAQRHQSRPTSVIGSESWSSTRRSASPRMSGMIPRLAGAASAAALSSSRRSSVANQRGSIIRTTTTTTLETPSAEDVTTSLRQRRVSESDQSSRPSGLASRRNGIVEPDLTRSAPENARSWIIYVLGGSYPENHPILTTPSLFTDSPTYEDMMLLSALLGPAKSPVATEKDIEEAGGIYKIDMNNGEDKIKAPLVAVATDGDDTIPILAEQRCLVCLCDLEQGEEARKLSKCEHLFHKECIDEWLTKGRNSCPLCRAQGVKEESKDESPARADSIAGGQESPRPDNGAIELPAHVDVAA